MRNKKEIRTMVSDGRLKEAAEAALAYAEAAGDVSTLNGLLAINSDLKNHQAVWSSGQISFEELARAQARITQHLLERVDELPDAPEKSALKKRTDANYFKWLVFYLFLSSKIIVFLWTFFMWKTFGFQNEEAMTAFNALLPGAIIYLSVMFKELFRSGVDGYAPKKYVSGKFNLLVWVIFCIYTIAQIFLILEKVRGNISFTTMNLAIVGVEAGMGRFVAEIVDGVFKQDKK